MMENPPSYCLPPIAGANTRLLILGSLPGVRSLQLSQYYGHPRNHFWPLLGQLINTDLLAVPYDDRLGHIERAGIGLWDVVAHAVRPGSLDQHMRDVLPNGLGEFVASLPSLRAIGFNGATASKIGRRQLAVVLEQGLKGIELIDLPSSSPANTMALERKISLWKKMQPYVEYVAQ
ncbi:MAG: DNA-deoxyinosine glycosylase [Sphingobium sp.]|nr:DNA-deoxyinosine glycosylase [Sphingobium sp.]